jgi:aerobic carbon-monoxide dehydrogenase large subunit
VEAPVGAPHERVEIAVLPEGVVEVTVGTQSTGQGHATAFAQVVADSLGCDPTQVRLFTGDTERVSAGGGTHSDRSMRLAGTLLVEASEHILDLAREFDPDRSFDLFELARHHALRAEASFTGRLAAYPTGAAVCEVEVDPETGLVDVTRYACVDDVGQPINPLIVEGQVHGGIAQGLGQALGESMVFEAHTAQVLSASFLDYPMPRAAWFPEFVSELVEDPTRGNPLRVKGGGESGITPSLPVVVNAVVEALRPLGVTDVEMPLSPARVWAAIERARTQVS